MENKQPLWHPSEELLQNSNMMKFIHQVNERFGLVIKNYNELYNWSIQNFEDFWSFFLFKSPIKLHRNYDKILKKRKDTIQWAKWFEGATLNFAENLLHFNDDTTAIIHKIEDSPIRYISYKELRNLSAKASKSLKEFGVAKGDRIAGYIANIPESIIAMLATTSIGALWSSTSPDFGLTAVLDRFGQIKPKILFAVDGYIYNGRVYSCKEIILNIEQKIPEIEHIVIIDIIGESDTYNKGKYIGWDEFISNENNEMEFEETEFNHPVYIVYSSGTTGAPKCIVHGAGGTLLQHYKELFLHTNLKPGERIFFYTTCGWMMWNWLVSSLMIGATVVLYDGSPAYPDLNALWDMVDVENISVFGTSPKYLFACKKMKIRPKETHSLVSLKTILSTGAPLTRDNFEWIYQEVKENVQLSSISGGTDIISCFVLGNPILPVYAEEIQCRGLGMKVEAYNEIGEPIINQKGELVCTLPFPSMPVFFWNDQRGEKYTSSYFNYYNGIWRHGDYIMITESETVIIFGRSDATLNRGGIRFGTTEIYRVVESIEFVSDSLVVGQKWKDDIRMILFVVLKPGYTLNDDLKHQILNSLRVNLSPRHLPDKIIQIDEIPVTLNGKKVELTVSKILNRESVTNIDSLGNPKSLEQFYNLKI